MSFRNFTTTAAAAALSLTLGSCVERWKETPVSQASDYYAQRLENIQRWWCNYGENSLIGLYNSCTPLVQEMLSKRWFQAYAPSIEPWLGSEEEEIRKENARYEFIAGVKILDANLEGIEALLFDSDIEARGIIEKSSLYNSVYNLYDMDSVVPLRDYIPQIKIFVRLFLVALNDEERNELYKDPRIEWIIKWNSTDVKYWLNLIEIYKKRRNT